MSEEPKKIYINSMFVKDTGVDGELILLDIRWDELKAQVESGICHDGRTHDSLINRQGYINLVIQRKITPYKKITHNVYNNDHKPNEK